MCGRYIPLTLRQIMRVIDVLAGEADWGREEEWMQEARQVYPGDDSQLVIPFEERLEPAEMRWGYEVGWRKGPIFNTRIESALKGGMWQDSIAHRRCIVPCRAFFEPHRSETLRSSRTGREIKRHYEFQNPEAPAILMAGVWENDRYSVVTCAPDEQMAPIHDRMPLVLTPEEARLWLGPRYVELADHPRERLVVQPEDTVRRGAAPPLAGIQETLF